MGSPRTFDRRGGRDLWTWGRELRVEYDRLHEILAKRFCEVRHVVGKGQAWSWGVDRSCGSVKRSVVLVAGVDMAGCVGPGF